MNIYVCIKQVPDTEAILQVKEGKAINEDNIKNLINDTNLYKDADNIIVKILSKSNKDSILSSYEEEIISDIVTPDFTKDLINQLINNLYTYLKNDNSEFRLEIDTKKINDIYSDYLNQNIKKENPDLPENFNIFSLPICDNEYTKSTFTIDLANPCLPKNFDPDKELEKTFIKIDPKFSNTEGKINILPKNIQENFNTYNIKKLYDYMENLPIFLYSLILITSLLLILLIPDINKSLLAVGIIGVIPSSANSLLLILFNYISKQDIDVKSINITDININSIFMIIVDRILIHAIFVSLILTGTYVLILLIRLFIRKNEYQNSASHKRIS